MSMAANLSHVVAGGRIMDIAQESCRNEANPPSNQSNVQICSKRLAVKTLSQGEINRPLR
jgi:hypothetical protein